mgnify:CR=1 FL=1
MTAKPKYPIETKGDSREYDVLLSFAGEDRAYVEQVAQALKQNGIQYFYDRDKEIEMWGNNLPQYVQQLYSTGEAKHCIAFISEAYNQKYYPQYELKSALVQELVQEDYILPVVMEKGVQMPPGILPTKVYKLAPENPDELADAIIKKLGKQGVSASKSDSDDSRASIRMPRVPKADFDAYEETEKAFFEMQDLLLKFSKKANQNGSIKFTVVKRNDRVLFRVQSAGEVLYYLDIWAGGGWGDNTICFSSGWGRPIGIGNSMNATAEIFWDTKEGCPMLKVHNYSLFGMGGGNFDSISIEDLVNKIWDVAIETVEKKFDKN